MMKKLLVLLLVLCLASTVQAEILLGHAGSETYTVAADETDLQALYGSIDIANEGAVEFDFQYSAAPYYGYLFDMETNVLGGGPGGFQMRVRANNGDDFYIEARDDAGSPGPDLLEHDGGTFPYYAPWTFDLDPHNFKMSWRDSTLPGGGGIEVLLDDVTAWSSSVYSSQGGAVDSSTSTAMLLGYEIRAYYPDQFYGTITDFTIGDTFQLYESIPEPATLGLLCLGGLMLRRRKS